MGGGGGEGDHVDVGNLGGTHTVREFMCQITILLTLNHTWVGLEHFNFSIRKHHPLPFKKFFFLVVRYLYDTTYVTVVSF